MKFVMELRQVCVMKQLQNDRENDYISSKKVFKCQTSLKEEQNFFGKILCSILTRLVSNRINSPFIKFLIRQSRNAIRYCRSLAGYKSEQLGKPNKIPLVSLRWTSITSREKV